ncbi:MAG: hypothetical protein ABEJ07_06215 [Candidatus Nanohaloarchaea archaeon]
MDSARFLVLSAVVILLAASATAYTGDGSTSDGSDEVDAVSLYCKFIGCGGGGGIGSLDTACIDGKDNNGRWGKDYSRETWDGDSTFVNATGHGDPGCASPIDTTENMMWDTDLTASMNDIDGGTPSVKKDPTVYFEGSLVIGNDMSGTAGGDSLSGTLNDKTSSSEVTERHLKSSNQGLAKNKYSATGLGSSADSNSKTPSYINNLPTGAVITGSGRIVDPPVDPADVSGGVRTIDTAVTCGDGKYASEDLNQNYFSGIRPADDGSKPAESPSGTTLLKSEIDIGCESDYGLLLQQPSHKKTLDDSEGDLGEYTSSDSLYSFSTVYTKTHDGHELTDTDDAGNAVCNKKDPKTGDCVDSGCKDQNPDAPDSITTNSYWSVSGDTMTKHKVERVGPYDTGYGEECGDKYEWDNSVETVNCNSFNQIHGGGRVTDREVIAGLEKPTNDRAGTYTDFTASGDDDADVAWCHYDPSKTLTVDADGPQGRGDGFVVVKDGDRIIGTKSPGQSGDSGKVGQMVYTATAEKRKNGGELTNSGRNFLQEMKGPRLLDCPETSFGSSSNYCIKYVDFYVSEQSKWGGVSQNPQVEDAVRMKITHSITPDESYSACKFINRVYKSPDSDEELIDCDFEANKNGGGDMSPLTQTCGDQGQEELLLAEGNQLDFPTLSKELYQSQACIDIGKDEDKSGTTKPGSDEVRKVTRNGCVLGGVPYAEGTVLNVIDYGNGVERNTPSPDYEVCLNPDIDSTDWQPWDNEKNQGPKSQGSDNGGEWYDLDNERVQSYVKNNFDSSDYSGQTRRIETYMVDNKNPQHSEYNPAGEIFGALALEDDCGAARDFAAISKDIRCEDRTSKATTGNLFYSFFDLGLG